MNSKTKGDISEAVIIAEFLKEGIPVSKPFGDNQPYDLIIDILGNLKKVQIKTGRIVNGCIYFRSSNSINTFLQKNKRRQSYKGKVDYIAVYCPENDGKYLININDCTNVETSLRILPPRLNSPNIRWAKNYILSRSSMVEQFPDTEKGVSSSLIETTV